MFSLTGLSNLTDGAGVHILTFTTDDPAHAWLNDLIAIGEGSIDPDAGLLLMRYYSCHVEHRPDLGRLRTTSPVDPKSHRDAAT
ncbi:MAG: hypothetical protein ACXV3S_01820 [Kineosporiaceae bacterium]